jgi:hypothetical protein
MYSPANTVTGRRHATTGTGQGDLVTRDAVGMSDCAAPSGEVTGEGLATSGRVLVGVPYPGVSGESHETTRGNWCVGRPNAAVQSHRCTSLLSCYLTLELDFKFVCSFVNLT